MNGNLILIINLLATWYMVGLIWMVQVVHYPLMDRVGHEGFARYAYDHSRLITPVVAIAMLIELVTAAALIFITPGELPIWAAWLGFVMVIAIWLSTALLQVPCHRVLGKGFDDAAYRRLVSSNWIRTVLWSARGILMAWYVTASMK